MQVYYVFAFSSRTEAMRFFKILGSRRVPSNIINTPRIITLGCGLSVKVTPPYFSVATEIFGKTALNGFLGAYEITLTATGAQSRRVFG